jgi:hypothetical protein
MRRDIKYKHPQSTEERGSRFPTATFAQFSETWPNREWQFRRTESTENAVANYQHQDFSLEIIWYRSVTL